MNRILFLLFMHLLMVAAACKEASEKSLEEKRLEEMMENQAIPSNGYELIDLLVEKASVRVSLDEDQKIKVRGIFEETFLDLYGDLSHEITKDTYLSMRKSVFFGSKERLKQLMKEESELE